MAAVTLSIAPESPAVRRPPKVRSAAYFVALLAVTLAALLAFVVEHLVATPSLALVFVLPVLFVALTGGWRPALLAAVASVVAFDFLFVSPRYSLRVDSPADVWTLCLLLVVAAAASVVAEQSRRRAVSAEREAARTEALRGLARVAAAGAPRSQVMQATATALSQAFGAPAAVLAAAVAGKVEVVALAGREAPSGPDLEAAGWAIAEGQPSHGGEYPFDRSAFEIWPLPDHALAFAVDRRERDSWPDDPSAIFELAGALISRHARAG